MKEHLSALVDGEIEAAAAGRLVDLVNREPELRRDWDVFLLIGDLMRNQPALSAGFAERVHRSLVSEPTVAVSRLSSMRAYPFGLFWAAAASVAGVAVLAWIVSGMLPDYRGAPPVVALGSRVGPSTMEPMHPDVTRAEFLLAHQGVSPTGFLYGFSHYARTVAQADRNSGADSR